MNVRASAWLLTMIVFLGGCTPAADPRPSGEISLKFERMSDTSLTLELANGLKQAVYIRGDRTFLLAIRAWPPDAEVSCQASESSGLTTEIVSFSQGGSEFVEIAPGKRVEIVIPTTLPQRSKGGSCSVYLHLKDDTRVGPVEFRPT
jgi:hypothetical protein